MWTRSGPDFQLYRLFISFLQIKQVIFHSLLLIKSKRSFDSVTWYFFCIFLCFNVVGVNSFHTVQINSIQHYRHIIIWKRVGPCETTNTAINIHICHSYHSFYWNTLCSNCQLLFCTATPPFILLHVLFSTVSKPYKNETQYCSIIVSRPARYLLLENLKYLWSTQTLSSPALLRLRQSQAPLSFVVCRSSFRHLTPDLPETTGLPPGRLRRFCRGTGATNDLCCLRMYSIVDSRECFRMLIARWLLALCR